MISGGVNQDSRELIDLVCIEPVELVFRVLALILNKDNNYILTITARKIQASLQKLEIRSDTGFLLWVRERPNVYFWLGST